MSSQSLATYIPSEAAVPSHLFTPDTFPGGKPQGTTATYSRHSRKRSYDMEKIHRHHDVASIKKDHRKTIDCGLAQLPIALRSEATRRIVQILPQRIMTPRFTTGIQSIWFRSESEHPDFGVSLVDIVERRAEGLMVAPEKQVFQGLGLDHDEIQFAILWPGYGYSSWIASIPIRNICEGRGRKYGPMTRRLLALVIAQHFRAFMTNHSYLRFPHPDPKWKIMNDRESGIRFEDLRLTRLFSHKDGTNKLGSWQAEILVVDDPHTSACQCIS